VYNGTCSCHRGARAFRPHCIIFVAVVTFELYSNNRSCTNNNMAPHNVVGQYGEDLVSQWLGAYGFECRPSDRADLFVPVLDLHLEIKSSLPGGTNQCDLPRGLYRVSLRIVGTPSESKRRA
jgi:hypothetical protein